MHDTRMPKDNWTPIAEKQERKKRQNRLNQRALRERKRNDEVRIVSGKRPYRVSRWKIGQPREQDPHIATPPQSSNELSIQRYAPEHSTKSDTEPLLALNEYTEFEHKAHPTPPSPVDFPLSADHLIRLIHQNVLSALMKNKSVLAQTTYLTRPAVQAPDLVIPPSRDFCDGLSLIHPIVERPIPQSLQPTSLQRSIPHASWLNIFPWPRFRDNLIVNESIIHGSNFLSDLFGDLGTYNAFPDEIDFNDSSVSEDEDDIHSRRRGLIVWGEPWDTDGWEVTPGFMRKWSWLLKGCEELVDVSNRWRARRNEEPLRWDVCSD